MIEIYIFPPAVTVSLSAFLHVECVEHVSEKLTSGANHLVYHGKDAGI